MNKVIRSIEDIVTINQSISMTVDQAREVLKALIAIRQLVETGVGIVDVDVEIDPFYVSFTNFTKDKTEGEYSIAIPITGRRGVHVKRDEIDPFIADLSAAVNSYPAHATWPVEAA